MNQYPKEEPKDFEDGLMSLPETERRIREALTRISERFQFTGSPKPQKHIVVMTPTGIPPQQDWVKQHTKDAWPNIWLDESGSFKGAIEPDNWDNPKEASIVEDRVSKFLKMGLGKKFAHLLPSNYPHLVEVARIREENIARIQNKLAGLSAIYGKDMSEKVNEAAEKLNRSVEECIDLFLKFKSISIEAEKFHTYENTRKLISEIKIQVGDPNKKESHATRDKIPVPKSYKRNRWSK